MATDDHLGTAPLYGFLADDSTGAGDDLRVEVVDGYWEVPASAVVRTWAQPTWQGTGRAVEVLVPAGTEVRFTKSFTVGSLDTPLTLTDFAIEQLGAAKVADMGKSWRVFALAGSSAGPGHEHLFLGVHLAPGGRDGIRRLRRRLPRLAG